MAQSTQAKPKTRQEKEALLKAARRAEQANILAGTRPLLEKDEQLLAFARARIAGGWKSKLNVGPEAFFAPFVNVALTEQRFLVQHVQHTTGRPSQMLPHAYTFDKIARVTFTDIETYGGELACRLILHLENGLYVRLRLRGQLNFAGAKNMAELFDSLTTARRKTPISPTHSLCPQCDHVLEQPYKFCPFCGTIQPSRGSNVQADAETPTLAHTGITIAVPGEAPLAEGTAGVLPTASPNGSIAFGGVGEAATPEMTIVRETDFAYERDDLPAEFGFALPTSGGDTEDVIEDTAEQAQTESGETGITVSADGVVGIVAEDAASGEADTLPDSVNAQDDADFDALADDSLFTPTDEAAQVPGEAEQGAEQGGASAGSDPSNAAEASFETASYDDMFAPDEPVQAQDAGGTGGVAFEQYDEQAFGELPFSDTPDEQFPGSGGAGLDVQEDVSDVVRDDTTEAFTPHSAADGGGTPADGGGHDAFTSAGTSAGNAETGDDNVDFNTNHDASPVYDNAGSDTPKPTDTPPTTTQPTQSGMSGAANDPAATPDTDATDRKDRA